MSLWDFLSGEHSRNRQIDRLDNNRSPENLENSVIYLKIARRIAAILQNAWESVSLQNSSLIIRIQIIQPLKDLPVYLRLGANITRTFSALHLTKCINLSKVQTAGFVEYTKWLSSNVILSVVGTSLLPKTNLLDMISHLMTGIRSLQVRAIAASGRCFFVSFLDWIWVSFSFLNF